MDDVALWPGNYPAGHYAPLLAICGPLLACMLVCVWMAIRTNRSDRKERRMDVGPLGPVDHQRGFFANRGGCQHPVAERVMTVDGEHVGWLCPDCDAALQPDLRDWPLPELPPFTPDPRLTTRV